MKVLMQRVSEARVTVADETVGAIGPGLLLLVGFCHDDDEERVRRVTRRVLDFRVFADADGRMNRSLLEVQGAVLSVSQFTLSADTRQGRRPGFSRCAAPELARQWYALHLEQLRASGLQVEQGRFAADMRVALVNDGPVTFLMD